MIQCNILTEFVITMKPKG